MATNMDIKKVVLIGVRSCHGRIWQLINHLLTQGTGTIGSIILSALQSSPILEVSVLSRASSTASFPASTPVIRADFDSEDDLVRAFKGQDAVVSAVGEQVFRCRKPSSMLRSKLESSDFCLPSFPQTLEAMQFATSFQYLEPSKKF